MQNYNPKVKSDLKTRAYRFSLNLINLINSLPNSKTTIVIINQVLRSGTSIGANIIEAQAASSKLEFKKYYEISLKSANETKYWLCLLRDSDIANKETIDPLLNEVIELSKMLAASVITLKGKR